MGLKMYWYQKLYWLLHNLQYKMKVVTIPMSDGKSVKVVIEEKRFRKHKSSLYDLANKVSWR